AQDQSPYGVFIDTTSGNLSGYGWSPHVGWVRFDPAGPFPSAPNHSARLVGETVEGWARVCSVFASGCDGALRPNTERGGWSGWILLAGAARDGSPYGVVIEDGVVSGWAWGSFIGWIDFSGTVPVEPPGALLVTLAADPPNGRAPLAVVLTANVSGSAAGPFIYRFDCENDGSVEHEVSSALQTATAECLYSSAGTYTASVRVTAAGGEEGLAAVRIPVFPPGPIENPPG
ncbi:MAG: hypothetical protein HY436_00015, partial [Candidatus Liptonbacteria bacterium]|nr:hypothetical protein [Candidatus Liptonbacteria bacterium]